MPLRRYEILLPLQYNDGSNVEPWKLRRAWEDAVERFGAASFEPGSIRGLWKHENQTYEDALVRMFVDVEDSPDVRAFFSLWKETLKERFDQIEIYITYHEIGRV